MSFRIAFVLLALGMAVTAVASGCAEGTAVTFNDDEDRGTGSANGSGAGTVGSSNSGSTSSGTEVSSSSGSGGSGGSQTSSSSSESSTSGSQSSSNSTSGTATSTSSGGSFCGDFICDPSTGEDCASCPGDCGACGPACGDLSCDSIAGETCSSCAVDCGPCGGLCGDAICDAAGGETCASCAVDCGPCAPTCGDAVCAVGEDCATCAADCGACGSCGHDVCDQGGALVNGCSPCVTQICADDSFCCTSSWDDLCVEEATSICGMVCNSCAHDQCVQGTALADGCNPCVTQICSVDPICCAFGWDSFCVLEVSTECGEFCP